MAADPPASLGEIIRRQRELSELSMRQFAQMAGISNPYLSQIERGLREPSEKVVEAIATSLRTTSDTLYEQAGLGPAAAGDDAPGTSVADAVRSDQRLTPTQRRALLSVYQAFVEGTPARRRRRPAPMAPGSSASGAG